MTSTIEPLQLSLFKLVRRQIPDLPIFQFSKATLVNLSHMLEDAVMSRQLNAMIFTGFQKSSYWQDAIQRYQQISQTAQNVYLFAGRPFPAAKQPNLLQIELDDKDPLQQEWFLVILSSGFHAVLAGLDNLNDSPNEGLRQFDTIWSFDPDIVGMILDLLEGVLEHYRPDRLEMMRDARKQFKKIQPDSTILTAFMMEMMQFEERLNFELGRTSNTLKTTIETLKRREQRLQQAEAKHRQLMEQVPAITYQLLMIPEADECHFTYVSPHIKKMLGLTPEHWLNGFEQWQAGIVEEHKRAVLNSLETAVSHKMPFIQEYLRKDSRGNSRWVRDEARLVQESDSNALVYQGLLFDITTQKLAEEKILKALTEKETLLKEVHHRVKNNLQIISSLFNLQSSSITDPDILNLLFDSQNRVKAMALIHQKLYQSPDIANINLKDYLQSLILMLQQTYTTSVCVHLDADEISVDIDRAVPIGLLINELITNTIKHAFPNDTDGKVDIIATQEKWGIQLQVSDNGIGLPNDLAEKENQSLGLRLIQVLARQLGAEILMESRDGTWSQISIPLPK